MLNVMVIIMNFINERTRTPYLRKSFNLITLIIAPCLVFQNRTLLWSEQMFGNQVICNLISSGIMSVYSITIWFYELHWEKHEHKRFSTQCSSDDDDADVHLSIIIFQFLHEWCSFILCVFLPFYDDNIAISVWLGSLAHSWREINQSIIVMWGSMMESVYLFIDWSHQDWNSLNE